MPWYWMGFLIAPFLQCLGSRNNFHYEVTRHKSHLDRWSRYYLGRLTFEFLTSIISGSLARNDAILVITLLGRLQRRWVSFFFLYDSQFLPLLDNSAETGKYYHSCLESFEILERLGKVSPGSHRGRNIIHSLLIILHFLYHFTDRIEGEMLSILASINCISCNFHFRTRFEGSAINQMVKFR